jgi:glycerol-3-phosphate dehydrogenase (NAD(P)+)
MSVAVLALGNWGTALANHLAVKGMDVLGWSLDREIVERVNSAHRNPHYQSQVQLSPKFKATENLAEALERPIVVLAFPSSALEELVPKLRVHHATLMVSAIKGFADESLLTPLQFAAKNLPQKSDLSVLSGPSFAKDIVVQNPSGVVAAAKDESVARRTAEIFSSDRMRVYVSTDTLGVELGGILKNVIALAAGVSDGLNLGDSAKAGLITRGLVEMMRLAKAMGAEEQTLVGLAGLGDLAMTATCDASRNRTVGLRLGKGEQLEHIISHLGSVAEGVRTTPLVVKLAERYKVEMPITFAMQRVLEKKSSPKDVIRELVSRPVKREFD